MTSLRRSLIAVPAGLLVLTILAGIALVGQFRALGELNRIGHEVRQLNQGVVWLMMLAVDADPGARVDRQWAVAQLQVLRSARLLGALPDSFAVSGGLLTATALRIDDNFHRLRDMPRHYGWAQQRHALEAQIHDLSGLLLNLADDANDAIRARIEKTRWMLVGLGIACLLLAAGFAVWLGLRLAGPLARFERALKSYVGGDHTHRMPAQSLTELDKIADAFNEMVDVIGRTTVARDRLEVENQQRQQAEAGARKALVELQAAQNRLRQAERLSALGTLVGGVAHEINNPLMGLASYADYLRARTSDEPSLAVLDKAEREIARMARIVRNTLLFSRTAAHQLARQRVSPDKVVDDALAALAADLGGQGIGVDRQRIGEIEVLADPEALRQILLNLLVNARDALCDVVGTRQVVLRGVLDGDSVCLELADTGSGIRREDRARIFEPFFTTKPAGKGSGLGLAVSRQLAEAMDGTLELVDDDSRPGACFRLRLKVAAPGAEGET